MKPTKETLYPFRKDIRNAANYFGVTEQTIRRWLKYYEIYEPKRNYGPNKLTAQDKIVIRKLYFSDKHTQQEIADKFEISQTMVGKIVNKYHSDIHFGANAEIIYDAQE